MKKRKLSLWLTLGCRKLHIEENHSPLKVVHRAEKPVQKVEQAFFFSPEKTRAGEYRYGFNGMEKDDEMKGNGNSYDLGLRCYDPRLGRMFSVDPRAPEYPWQSPYAYHRNNPVNRIDYLGGGDPPEKENKYKAPEMSREDVSNSYQIANDGELALAFSRNTGDPLYGFVKGANDQYDKVFFDPSFDNGGEKGAYFAHKPKRDVLQGVAIPQAGFGGIELDLNDDGTVSQSSLDGIQQAVQDSFESIPEVSPPNEISTGTEFVHITIYHSNGTLGDPVQESSNANQIMTFLNEQIPGLIIIDTSSRAAPKGNSAVFLSEGEVIISLSKKQYVYDF